MKGWTYQISEEYDKRGYQSGGRAELWVKDRYHEAEKRKRGKVEV